uniref:Oxysterol binding protein-like 11 n=1 Tax=Eptatretus burgeri TaxID=7764 RepID=A0A8C4RB95_EPTBU
MSVVGTSPGSADTMRETIRHSSYYPGKGSEWEQLTGYLQKYTNLVTGWQFRYFVLNWENGELEYFVTEPQGRSQKPRGVIALAGAMISPSEDDSYAFSVMAVNGEQFRLRAKDAKERQHWVSRLQGCAQHYTEAIGLLNPPPVTHDTSLVPSPMRRHRRLPVEGRGSTPDTKPQTLPCSIPGLVNNSHFERLETLRQVTRMLIHVGKRQRDLARALSELPSSRSPVICLDSDLLILKASAAATLACLHDCLGALRTGSAWNSSLSTTRFPGRLWLKEHGEEYTFSLPSAYARSILTVPWVELGGKVSISCASSGYSASITFHTKPFYGGKLHRVNAEVKHVASTTVVCRAQGEWNGMLEFAYNNNTTKTIDTSTLPVTRKRVRPLCNQRPFESRRLWQNVTNALRADDVEKATEQKHKLEQRQRLEERQRLETNTTYVPKYFVEEGDGWVYHKPLWKPT